MGEYFDYKLQSPVYRPGQRLPSRLGVDKMQHCVYISLYKKDTVVFFLQKILINKTLLSSRGPIFLQ